MLSAIPAHLFGSLDIKSWSASRLSGISGAKVGNARKPMIQLVKAFLRLLTVGDEFNGFDVGGGHKTSVLRLVRRPKVARLGGGGKDSTIIA